MSLNTLEQFEFLLEEGLVSKSETEDLVLYNYTDKCTFAKHWNQLTMSARGTIYEKATGQVVARAFDKFFNLGEQPVSEPGNLPDGQFYVSEKMDGSMGTLYFWKGEWKVATRGSFYSEQAVRATEMLKRYDMSSWDSDYTPIVEIIYPENKILVNYGEREELVLIGARHIETGVHAIRPRLISLARNIGMSVAPLYVSGVNITGKDAFEPTSWLDGLTSQAKKLPLNNEGWVVLFMPSGLQVKIKGARYVEVARFKAHLGPLTVWEKMMEGSSQAYIEALPDELQAEATDIVDALVGQLDVISETPRNFWANTIIPMLAESAPRKEIALQIQSRSQHEQGYLFAKLTDSKNPTLSLLKLLRPTGNKLIDLDKFK